MRLLLNQEAYEEFNQATLQSEGVTFNELAANNPAEAYLFLNQMLELDASKFDEYTSTEGIRVTKELDGEAAVFGFATQALRERQGDYEVKPVDVVITVFQKPTFRDRIRGRKTEPKQIVSFRVEPPEPEI